MAKRQLTPEFREFLACLNRAGVEYLLVGGYAVKLQANKRASGRNKDLADLDISLCDQITNESLRRVSDESKKISKLTVDLRRVPRITLEGILNFQAACPACIVRITQ